MTISSISKTEADDFIPEIWANTALPILRDNIFITPRVYTDSDVAAFTRGDILHIAHPGTMSPSPKSAYTEYTLAQPTTVPVTLTLNKQYATSFLVEDVVRAESNVDLMATYAEAAAIGIARQVELDGIACLEGTGTSIGTTGVPLDFADILLAWETLTTAKVPAGQRYMAITPGDIVSLLGDDQIQTWAAFSRGNQIVSSPMNLGAIGGFDEIGVSQLLTAVGGTPSGHHNLAWRRDGAMVAFRGLPEPPANSGAVGATVRDPESGVVLRTVMAYDATFGGVRVTYEVLYGWAILDEAKVLVVES